MDHFLAGDVVAAATLHRRLLPLTAACFATTSPIPLKYALGRVGFPIGRLRLPLVELDDEAPTDGRRPGPRDHRPTHRRCGLAAPTRAKPATPWMLGGGSRHA